MSITTYIIYQEKEGSQAGAMASGNRTIIEVDDGNPASVAMFAKMRFAFAQDAEHVKIEVLNAQKPINVYFAIETAAYMQVPREIHDQGGDEAIKKYVIEHQYERYDAEHPTVRIM
jgi:hypothetical protein